MRIRRIATLGVALAGALALASCTGVSAGGGGGEDDGSIRYLMSQPEDPAVLEEIKAEIKRFEADHEGVTVTVDAIPNDTLRTILQTQLRSADGPDVFDYDTGPGFAGALAEAGLLYDLSDAYAENDWPIYEFAKNRVTFGGQIVGIPDEVEAVGLYYNADIFAEQGIEPPETVADVAAAAEQLKSAGIIPITFGDKAGWPAGHILSMILASDIGSQGMAELIDGETPWNSPAVVDAISLFFDQYNGSGFLPPTPTAIEYNDANALFYSGQAAMNLTGTWLVQDIETNTDFEVGFMPFPGPDGAGIYAGGLGGGVFMSKNSDNPDAALEFLDFLVSTEHGEWEVATMKQIPAFAVDTSGIDASPLFSQVLGETAKLADGSGDFGVNIDVLTGDNFNRAMWDGLQAVLIGQKTPEQVADEMQAAYEADNA